MVEVDLTHFQIGLCRALAVLIVVLMVIGLRDLQSLYITVDIFGILPAKGKGKDTPRTVQSMEVGVMGAVEALGDQRRNCLSCHQRQHLWSMVIGFIFAAPS